MIIISRKWGELLNKIIDENCINYIKINLSSICNEKNSLFIFRNLSFSTTVFDLDSIKTVKHVIHRQVIKNNDYKSYGLGFLLRKKDKLGNA